MIKRVWILTKTNDLGERVFVRAFAPKPRDRDLGFALDYEWPYTQYQRKAIKDILNGCGRCREADATFHLSSEPLK